MSTDKASMEMNLGQFDGVSGGTSMAGEEKDKICRILAATFDMSLALITGNSSLNGDLGADSFKMSDIAGKIEEAFCIRIPRSDLPRFRTVDDLVEYVRMRRL